MLQELIKILVNRILRFSKIWGISLVPGSAKNETTRSSNAVSISVLRAGSKLVRKVKKNSVVESERIY